MIDGPGIVLEETDAVCRKRGRARIFNAIILESLIQVAEPSFSGVAESKSFE